MNSTITICPASTEDDRKAFWSAKNEYLIKDILPNSDLGGAVTDDSRSPDMSYFLSAEYHDRIEALCDREIDRARMVFFELEGSRIGFCLYCSYVSEDGKCFILDFCVFPEYRGHGFGKRCFAALKEKTIAEGTAYFELNTHSERSKRFWEALGFVYNGYDSHGSILLILPPLGGDMGCAELAQEDIWQILSLQNSYKFEIGEPFLSDDQQDALTAAVEHGEIRFFVCKRMTRIIGMCSLCRVFSTYTCTGSGIFEDFFVEPAFRKSGCARLLTEYVQKLCSAEGITSLWVGCADSDVGMYRSLGFEVSLGNLLAWNTGSY